MPISAAEAVPSGSGWLHFGSTQAAFGHPDCSDHLLLNLPVNTALEWRALATRPAPSAAVLDRAVDLVAHPALSGGIRDRGHTRTLCEDIALLAAQPGLSEDNLITLFDRLSWTHGVFGVDQDEPGPDHALTALLAHPNTEPHHVAPLLGIPKPLLHLQGKPSATSVGAELQRRCHPILMALDLVVEQSWDVRRPVTVADIATVLTPVREQAAAVGSSLQDVADAYHRLKPDWHGGAARLVRASLDILT